MNEKDKLVKKLIKHEMFLLVIYMLIEVLAIAGALIGAWLYLNYILSNPFEVVVVGPILITCVAGSIMILFASHFSDFTIYGKMLKDYKDPESKDTINKIYDSVMQKGNDSDDKK